MAGKAARMKCQKGRIINRDHKVQITILHQRGKALQVAVHHQQTVFGNIIKEKEEKMSQVFLICIVIIHLISQIQIPLGHNQQWTEHMVLWQVRHRNSWPKVTKNNSNISYHKDRVNINQNWLIDHLKQYFLDTT